MALKKPRFKPSLPLRADGNSAVGLDHQMPAELSAQQSRTSHEPEGKDAVGIELLMPRQVDYSGVAHAQVHSFSDLPKPMDVAQPDLSRDEQNLLNEVEVALKQQQEAEPALPELAKPAPLVTLVEKAQMNGQLVPPPGFLQDGKIEPRLANGDLNASTKMSFSNATLNGLPPSLGPLPNGVASDLSATLADASHSLRPTGAPSHQQKRPQDFLVFNQLVSYTAGFDQPDGDDFQDD